MIAVSTNRASGRSALSYNLQGQRLGRKGRVTRQRILLAAEHLLSESDAAISLSAIAREASLSMTTIYIYFADLTELVLALLEPLLETAEESHLADLRQWWSDDILHARCLHFVLAFHSYWRRNSRLLHLRNQLADGGDQRLQAYRVDVAAPMIDLFVKQMNSPLPIPVESATTSRRRAMAAVLVTGVERVVTVNTGLHAPSEDLPIGYVTDVLAAQAVLLELGIREYRRIE